MRAITASTCARWFAVWCVGPAGTPTCPEPVTPTSAMRLPWLSSDAVAAASGGGESPYADGHVPAGARGWTAGGGDDHQPPELGAENRCAAVIETAGDADPEQLHLRALAYGCHLHRSGIVAGGFLAAEEPGVVAHRSGAECAGEVLPGNPGGSGAAKRAGARGHRIHRAAGAVGCGRAGEAAGRPWVDAGYAEAPSSGWPTGGGGGAG